MISSSQRPLPDNTRHSQQTNIHAPGGIRTHDLSRRVLSGRGLCDELITRPEESYRLCCVVVDDLETSRMGAPYIYIISSLKVNDLTLILLTWRKWWASNNASKQQMGFNSGFKGLSKKNFLSVELNYKSFSFALTESKKKKNDRIWKRNPQKNITTTSVSNLEIIQRAANLYVNYVVVTMKVTVIRNVTLCGLVQIYRSLTHCGRVTQICIFTLQLCRTGDADLRF